MERRSERGVTLLEILIAMLLLGIALVGLAASFPLAMFGVTLGGYQTTATLLAQQSLEQARAKTYATISTLDTGGGVCTTAGGGTFAAVTEFPGFERCVSAQTATPTATTTTVTVVVKFAAGGGDPIYTRLATIITQ
jgi:prepilin-type N-terminal cleavage/methylation domain-containing protein